MAVSLASSSASPPTTNSRLATGLNLPANEAEWAPYDQCFKHQEAPYTTDQSVHAAFLNMNTKHFVAQKSQVLNTNPLLTPLPCLTIGGGGLFAHCNIYPIGYNSIGDLLNH